MLLRGRQPAVLGSQEPESRSKSRVKRGLPWFEELRQCRLRCRMVRQGRGVHRWHPYSLRFRLHEQHLPRRAGGQRLEADFRLGHPYRLRARHFQVVERGQRPGARLRRCGWVLSGGRDEGPVPSSSTGFRRRGRHGREPQRVLDGRAGRARLEQKRTDVQRPENGHWISTYRRRQLSVYP